MHPLKKLWRLARRYATISLRTESEFRPDFWTSIVQLLFNAALVIAFWDALFRLTGPLQGWTLADFVMMAGLGELSRTISGFFSGLEELPEKIVRGEIDRFLARPAPLLFCYLGERISLVRIFHSLVAGLVTCLVAVWQLDFRLSWTGVLLGLLLMVVGRLAFMLMQGVVALLSFWLGRMQHLQAFLGELSQFNRYPVTLFDPPVRLVLTWVWPYGLYLTYPVILLRGDSSQASLLLTGAGLLLLLWVLVLQAALRAGLRRYESYGG